MTKTPNVHNIPAGNAFVTALSHFIETQLQDLPALERADALILLPTRRAKRSLQNALVQSHTSRALIMPRIKAIGDVDEDDINLNLLVGQAVSNSTVLSNKLLNIPPALPRMKRRLMLARLLMAAPDFVQSFENALSLAATLGQFMDHVYTEGLSWDKLDTLVDDEFAAHWQITLDFLKTITLHWPKILADEGMIDYADRRHRLLSLLNDIWQESPPQTPIIAAGSTGSIPAVANLLKTIAHLPRGHVILPGLDIYLDNEDWEEITPVHPQYILKNLIHHIGITREHIKDLPKTKSSKRTKLIGEIMRPSTTTEKWLKLDKEVVSSQTVENLSILECESEKNEAISIALAVRELFAQSDTDKIVIVTPDRTLAERVKTACARWQINVDDSAGTDLSKSSIGTFALVSLNTLSHNYSPITVLSLLNHPHFALIDENTKTLLDSTFRGIKPPKGLNGLKFLIDKYYQDQKRRGKYDEDEHNICLNALEKLQTAFLPLQETHDTHILNDWIKKHLETIRLLSTDDHISVQDNDFIDFIHEMQESADAKTAFIFDEYAQIFKHLIDTKTVRQAHSDKTRVHILGQLEARLIDADRVIIAGLNEGVWPTAPSRDPWMSRQMHDDFGLPDYDRSIGLAAHDFVQAASMPRVLITRTRKSGGAPTVPSRWLLRLEAILNACEKPRELLFNTSPYAHWGKTLDTPDHFEPCNRPAPNPPLEARPKHLSATDIEKWLQDPYSIYASKILKLRTLDPFENEISPADKGTVLHKTLELFNAQYPLAIPENAADDIRKILKKCVELYCGNTPENTNEWYFWTKRMQNILEKYITHETQHRCDTKLVAHELYGKTDINIKNTSLTLSARADRIDRGHDGYIIIDYKSGGTFSQKGFSNGKHPQMPVEAVILAQGGFTQLETPHIVRNLQYWVFNSQTSGVKITSAKENIDTILETTYDNLQNLIKCFYIDGVPYYSLPNPSNTLRFNDFEHLSRLREWGIIQSDDMSIDMGGS